MLFSAAVSVVVDAVTGHSIIVSYAMKIKIVTNNTCISCQSKVIILISITHPVSKLIMQLYECK